MTTTDNHEYLFRITATRTMEVRVSAPSEADATAAAEEAFADSLLFDPISTLDVSTENRTFVLETAGPYPADLSIVAEMDGDQFVGYTEED